MTPSYYDNILNSGKRQAVERKDTGEENCKYE